VYLPYEYVNRRGPKARVRDEYDLSLVLIFLTRFEAAPATELPRSRAIRHIFSAPLAQGDDGYACFSVCCHSCCARCPGVRRGGPPDPTSRSKIPTHGPTRNRYHFSIRAVCFFFSILVRARVYRTYYREREGRLHFFLLRAGIRHRRINSFSRRALILIDRCSNYPRSLPENSNITPRG